MSRMPSKKKKKKKRKNLAEKMAADFNDVEKMSVMHTISGEFVDTEAMPEGIYEYKAVSTGRTPSSSPNPQSIPKNQWVIDSWEKEFARAKLDEAVQREDLPEPRAGKKIPLLNTMSVGELERLEDNARIMVRVTRHSLGRPQHFLCCLIRQANGRISVQRLSNGHNLRVYRTGGHSNHIDPTSFSSEAEIIKFIRKRKHIM